jgi:hypothetical protein
MVEPRHYVMADWWFLFSFSCYPFFRIHNYNGIMPE